MQHAQLKHRKQTVTPDLTNFKFFKNFRIIFREKGKIPETGVYEIADCLEELPNFRCGSYKDYRPEDDTAPQGKDKDLYKVGKGKSHQDVEIMIACYLQEKKLGFLTCT